MSGVYEQSKLGGRMLWKVLLTRNRPGPLSVPHRLIGPALVAGLLTVGCGQTRTYGPTQNANLRSYDGGATIGLDAGGPSEAADSARIDSVDAPDASITE